MRRGRRAGASRYTLSTKETARFASFLTIQLELEDRDIENEQLLEELESLRSRVAQVDRLQQENESLQAEISRLREIQDIQVVPSDRRTVLGELSPNKSSGAKAVLARKAPHDAAAEYSDPANFKAVVAKCKELDVKYKGVCKLLEEHRLTLRKRAKIIERWARHSDTLQGEIDQLRARPQLSFSSKDGASITQAGEAGVVTAVDNGSSVTGDLKRPNPGSTPIWGYEPPSSPPPLVAVPGGNSALSPPRRILSEPPPRLPTDDMFQRTASATDTESSLSTTGDEDLPPYLEQPVEAGPAAVKVEISSDPPIIVSTRLVHKRKHAQEDPEVVRAQKVKLEHSSSSGPEIIRESHHYSPAESIDFDEEIHVPTPRKRRALPKSGYDNAITTLGAIPRPKLPLQGHVGLEAYRVPDQSHAQSHDIVESKPHKSSSLRDTTPQQRTTRRAVIAGSSLRPDYFTSDLALGVKDLAEDGDAEKRVSFSDQIQRPMAKGRLDALLNSPSVKPRPSISRDDRPETHSPRPVPAHDSDGGTSFTAAKHVGDSGTTPQNRKRSMPRQDARSPPSPIPSVSRERAPKTASIIRNELPRGRPLNKEETALRERPIETLRPEDFKPNPLYNDGLSFVYDEVVRGKDARAAISGCIDPNCCGKTFRRFAEAELKSVGSSVTRRAEDVGLMERYLGDEAFKLGIMTREEREEAWLKAKTCELANKFGTHRQRYSRMPSPPGFWSMDFPNTQERAEELRQAEEIRKALVSERHREAMRCKGSWLFRDEDPR